MLRDACTFPVPQSKLLAALYGATFSFEPTVQDMGMLLRQDEVKISLNFHTPVEAAACTTPPGTPQSL